MLACLGHLNIQWDLPRCPSSWHSCHLYPFVMLNFQCLVASSLGQSMPHSCSFKDPMCFPFSISGYMPATKIKSLHSTACILSDSMSLLSKFVPYSDHNFKDKCGIKHKISKKNKSSEHFEDHVIPSAFYTFHLISFTRISRGPSHHKSGSLNNKYHSTSQSTARKSPANVRAPSITSSEPRPKQIEKPFRGHGRMCWPHPPWPPQRSAARPRRHGRSQPPHAAPCRLGRRGCDADGGAAAAAVEKQSV